MKDFFKNWSKKQKIGVGTVCVAGVLLFGGVVLADTLAPKQAAVQADKKETSEAAYGKKVDQLINEVYADKTLEKLSPNFNEKKSTQIKQVLATAPKGAQSKEVTEKEDQLTNALHMFTVTTELDNAYEKDGIVKADAKLTDTEGLLVLLKESKPKFYELQQKRATEVKTEIAVIADTTKAVNELFTDQTKTVVKEDVSKESYAAVLAKVEGLKQVGLKGSLLASLAVVDAKVTEKELAAATVEAEKVAQEAAVAVEAAKQEQAAQNQVTASNNQESNSSNSNNQSVGSSATPNYEASPGQSAPSQPAQPSAPANNNGGGGWSGTGNTTEGGNITNHGDNGGSNGATGGGGTWTGGDFDGSGINTDGWN
ncbi:hypothetical protein [Carnobacterium maltaromaticum]|uniref:hypothetical protein n=1 Tax=Carnobacterium maltaromaticum TaxID=2751 RepID=UPI0012FAE495|nr:hypothetical protein [Carnobacterium maltaromaticum]